MGRGYNTIQVPRKQQPRLVFHRNPNLAQVAPCKGQGYPVQTPYTGTGMGMGEE